jgi:hypothetical protein
MLSHYWTIQFFTLLECRQHEITIISEIHPILRGRTVRATFERLWSLNVCDLISRIIVALAYRLLVSAAQNH